MFPHLHNTVSWYWGWPLLRFVSQCEGSARSLQMFPKCRTSAMQKKSKIREENISATADREMHGGLVRTPLLGRDYNPPKKEGTSFLLVYEVNGTKGSRSGPDGDDLKIDRRIGSTCPQMFFCQKPMMFKGASQWGRHLGVLVSTRGINTTPHHFLYESNAYW